MLRSHPVYLGLVRLPANHVEDVEGGGDAAVWVAVHLWGRVQPDQHLKLESKNSVGEEGNIRGREDTKQEVDTFCNSSTAETVTTSS